MKVYEFGDKNKPGIMLFPGTCCYWKSNFGHVLENLQKLFYTMVVSYSGFDETENTTFISELDEVKKVENKIDVQKLKEELSSQVLKELEYKIPVSARIIDSKDKYNVGKNMIEYVVTVTTKEDIAKLDILSKSEAESIIKSNEEKKSKEEGEQKPSNPENRPINDIRNEFKEDIKSNTDDEEN